MYRNFSISLSVPTQRAAGILVDCITSAGVFGRVGILTAGFPNL